MDDDITCHQERIMPLCQHCLLHSSSPLLLSSPAVSQAFFCLLPLLPLPFLRNIFPSFKTPERTDETGEVSKHAYHVYIMCSMLLVVWTW